MSVVTYRRREENRGGVAAVIGMFDPLLCLFGFLVSCRPQVGKAVGRRVRSSGSERCAPHFVTFE